jgi:hypothetical protein
MVIAIALVGAVPGLAFAAVPPGRNSPVIIIALGTVEWVQYDFAKPREVSSAEVYWFDDTGRGACRVPQSWRLLYKDGDAWKPVEGASEYGVKADQFNKVTFTAVKTTGLRLEAQLQKDFSGGILEWRVGP